MKLTCLARGQRRSKERIGPGTRREGGQSQRGVKVGLTIDQVTDTRGGGGDFCVDSKADHDLWVETAQGILYYSART